MPPEERISNKFYDLLNISNDIVLSNKYMTNQRKEFLKYHNCEFNKRNKWEILVLANIFFALILFCKKQNKYSDK